MKCLYPEPMCSWLDQPSVCVFLEALQVCVSACVYLYVKRVEPPDYTTCASLCQQLNVCRVLFLFGTLSAVSRCVTADVAAIIHHVLWKTDNLRACDLPAEEYSMTTQKGGGRKSWVVIFQCSGFLTINEALKFPFMNGQWEKWERIGSLEGKRQFDKRCVVCILLCLAAFT